MNKNKAITELTELRSVATSKNGFPIYDLFHPTYPSDGHGGKLSGYVGSTGIMFYTEDNKILNELGKVFNVDTTEAYQDFLKLHINNLYNTSELREINVHEMTHEEAFSYGHLCIREYAKRTLANKSYGCAHLDLGNQMLVFHQRELNSHINISKIDLNDKEDYQKVRTVLLDLYKKDKIKPEAVFTGQVYENIKLALNDFSLESLTKYQKDVSLLLIDFKNEINVQFSLDFKSNNGKYEAIMKHADIEFSFAIPENKKDGYSLVYNGTTLNKEHKDIGSVLDTVYGLSTDLPIYNFISKIKI